jgi:transcriptional/translational regulatory protein YebC/TACO1
LQPEGLATLPASSWCHSRFLHRSVKAGGPDPVSNSKLDTLIKQAKDLGVPKDIIERNIKRATDTKQADFAELIYEAYGPGGTGFLVECLTDNVNRSASEVKSTITKSGNKVETLATLPACAE